MKEDALLGKSTKEKVKEIIGTCNSMGILVEGVPAKEAIKMINEGKFDKEIASGKTELSADELKELEEEKKKLAQEMEKRRTEYETKAKEILNTMKNKGASATRSKMMEEKIPQQIIDEICPAEDKKAGGAAPAKK